MAGWVGLEFWPLCEADRGRYEVVGFECGFWSGAILEIRILGM
jgi:hypothetical protein